MESFSGGKSKGEFLDSAPFMDIPSAFVGNKWLVEYVLKLAMETIGTGLGMSETTLRASSARGEPE